MSIKSTLLNEFQSVIKSNIMRHERMRVSLCNAVTTSRKQKIERDLARQANYVYQLTKLYNRFSHQKLPLAESVRSIDGGGAPVPQTPNPASDVYAKDVMVMA